ncbi:EI24 domain-containing protein [Nocardiopsis trehalosi]|uniref:EI24 domain-containing protein n=1 Tax=Nocardiopsis trehalosi TaxID=109329 RepID=UPI0008300B86|nr:EI24 domain-containing protein [Nocardiopsis trehalosi]
MSTPIRDAASGVGILLRGFGMVFRRPKLFLMGAIPPLFTSLLFLAAFIALIMNIESLTAWLTPFADGWSEGWRTTVRAATGVILVAGSVLIMVVGFTGLTLALGFPLYDKIAEDVEDELGDAPPQAEESIAGSVARAIRQSLTIILITALVTVPMFFAGFIPVVGQTVVPALSAVFGGWMLTMELVGTAFDRRGLRRLKDRRWHMGRHRMLVLGFAVPSYLLLAIPFVAVLVFPAATAGGTILARRLIPAASAPPGPGRLPYGAPQPGPTPPYPGATPPPHAGGTPPGAPPQYGQRPPSGGPGPHGTHGPHGGNGPTPPPTH